MKTIMKKAIFIAALAASLCSCTELNIQNSLSDNDFVKMTFTADSVSTKFSIGTLSDGKYPVRWNKAANGETARIYERRNGAFGSERIVSESSSSEDGIGVSFTFSVPAASASSYEYYFISPSTYSYASGNNNIVRASIPSTYTQIPSFASPDKNAMPVIAAGGTYTSQPESFSGNFEFMGSIGKMTILNYAGPTTVSNISISFDNKSYVLGFLDYNVSTGAVSLTQSTSISGKVINLNPKNLAINAESFDVWFGIPAISLAAGEKFTLTFETASGKYIKTCTVPSGYPLTFTRGHVTGFRVDMAGVAPAAATKTLTFDFIETDSSKLPTAASTSLSDEYKNFTWPADDGNSYQFYNAGYFYHSATATNAMLAAGSEGSVFAYLGLPALAGYKLTTVALQRAYSSERQVEITSACPIGSTESLTGAVVVTVANPSIDLTGKTEVGKMYYLRALVCSNNYVDIKKIILTYTIE